MQIFSWLLILLFSWHLTSCGSEESSNVEMIISGSTRPLIPAPTSSCLARKNAGAEPPAQDITESYFTVPTVTFKRKDTSKLLYIALLRITIRIPGESSPVTCEVGGDGLAALSSTWWASSTKEPLVDPGVASFVTDCSLYCGGIKADRSYVATGIVEAFGLERDVTSLEETPVKLQTELTIQSF